MTRHLFKQKKRRSTWKEYTQVAIKTEKAVKQLRFIQSETVERIDSETLRIEQKAYQKSFAQELEKIINQ